MTRQKEKDWDRMLAIFRKEFHEGCDTLRNQKAFMHGHRSVWQYIDWFDSHWRRMLDERYPDYREDKSA